MQYRKTFRYWWYCPHKLIVFFLCPLYTFLCIYPFNELQQKGMYDGNYYVDSFALSLGLYFLFLIAGSSYLVVNSTNFVEPVKRAKPFLIDKRYLEFIVLTSILSYFIWFRWLFSSPQILLQVVAGSAGFIKNTYETIPGITTLSQLGVLYIIIFFLDVRKGRKFPTRFKLYFIACLILALFRTILWSERLALIEVFVPLGLIYLATVKVGSRVKRILINMMPFIAVVALFAVFGFFEFFRSWNRYQYSYTSYSSFIIDRLSLYYFTAINNVAAIIHETDWPSYSLKSYFNWLYKFPFIGRYFTQFVPDESYGNWGNFLDSYLDPEFNNPSGVLVGFTDSGLLGATFFAVSVGVLSGISYLGFILNKGISKYVFPLFFIYLLDVIRISYISESRVFPIVIFLFLAYLGFRKIAPFYKIRFLQYPR